MKLYNLRESRVQQREAMDHALDGGQALLLVPSELVPPGAPACFRKGRDFGKIFDQDLDRLMATARSLGVRKVAPHESRGVDGSLHVDICGAPLVRALARAERDSREAG